MPQERPKRPARKKLPPLTPEEAKTIPSEEPLRPEEEIDLEELTEYEKRIKKITGGKDSPAPPPEITGKVKRLFDSKRKEQKDKPEKEK